MEKMLRKDDRVAEGKLRKAMYQRVSPTQHSRNSCSALGEELAEHREWALQS